MSELTRPIRRLLGRSDASSDTSMATPATDPMTATSTADLPTTSITVDIPESDPLIAYLQTAPGPVELARLELDSPAVRALRDAGVALVVPLVSQGELIGTLNLGPRLSEQDYSTDDRRLLTTLAAQAAPAIRVAQLVREQAHEAAERERLEQEMRVATLIQQQFLPRELPNLPQWQIAAYYGPARAVGGDFYDFIEMPDGRIGIAVGDVTDKGVPAALVMARTHSILRAEAGRSDSPGEILARANALLEPEMPARMFVTCLFAILEPETGRIVMANAGHNLPYIRTDDGVVELRATGMPLGLMPGIRLRGGRGRHRPGQQRPALLGRARRGPRSEPADVRLPAPARGDDRRRRRERAPRPPARHAPPVHRPRLGAGGRHHARDPAPRVRRCGRGRRSGVGSGPCHRLLGPGRGGQRAPGDGPRRGVDRRPGPATGAARAPQDRGQRGRDERHRVRQPGPAEVPVDIVVETTADAIVVRITDRALSGAVPTDAETPDIERKLAGEQKPRGWGLFLIKNMVDSMDVTSDGSTQTVTLTMAREERTDG